MKKNLMLMSLAMMGLCVFTACSSDDDKKGNETLSIQDSEYDTCCVFFVSRKSKRAKNPKAFGNKDN